MAFNKRKICNKDEDIFAKCVKTDTTDKLQGQVKLNGLNEIELYVYYDRMLIDQLKSVNGRRFDGNKKAWVFPLAKYDDVKNVLNNFNIRIENELLEEDFIPKPIVVLRQTQTEKYEVLIPKYESIAQICRDAGVRNDSFKKSHYINASEKDVFISLLEKADVTYHLEEGE